MTQYDQRTYGIYQHGNDDSKSARPLVRENARTTSIYLFGNPFKRGCLLIEVCTIFFPLK